MRSDELGGVDSEGDVEAGTVVVLDALSARIDLIADEAMRAISAEIDRYESLAAAGSLSEDVHAHVVANIEAFLDSVRASKPPVRSELTFLTQTVARRVAQGIELDALLHAFRVGHRVTWDAIRRQAADLPNGNSVALALVRPSMEYIDSVSTLVAETYTAVQRERDADADLAQRDELDMLLVGRPTPGGRIEPGIEVIVVVASTGGKPDAVRRTRRALSVHAPERVLTVATGGEGVIAVLPVQDGPGKETADMVRTVSTAARHLDTESVKLRAGSSLPCIAPAEIPRAREEAAAALEMTDDERAVVALSELSPSDYLLRTADDTARRIVPPGIRALVESENPAEQDLVRTVIAWGECDLNVRRTAQRLHVHPNTVHQRLRRIEERTALDLHRFADVVAVTVSIRLLGQ